MSNLITSLERGINAFNSIEVELKSKGVIGQAEVVPVEDFADRIELINSNISYYNLWNIVKRIINSSRAILPDNTTASYASIMLSTSGINVFALNFQTTRALKLSDYGGSISLSDGTLTIELGAGTPKSINLYIDLSGISANIEHILIIDDDAESATDTLTINNLVIIDSITYSMPSNTDVTIGSSSNNYVTNYSIQYFRADTLTTQDQKINDGTILLVINGTNNVNTKNISPVFNLQ